MRLGLLGLFTLAAIAEAKLAGKKKDEGMKLKPSDVGRLHTNAFDKLGEILNTRKEMSEVELMMEVSKISSTFCPKGDSECEAHAYKATVTEFDRAKKGNRVIEYPRNFDGKVRALMNRMHRTLRGYDGKDQEKVMGKLYDIQNKLENMKDVDTLSQTTGLVTISVALESTKLWSSAHQEETHPLHRSLATAHNQRDRKLQVVYEDVILADVNSTIANAISLVGTIGTNNPFTVLAVPPILFISLAQFAIPASVNAAFPDGVVVW